MLGLVFHGVSYVDCFLGVFFCLSSFDSVQIMGMAKWLL